MQIEHIFFKNYPAAEGAEGRVLAWALWCNLFPSNSVYDDLAEWIQNLVKVDMEKDISILQRQKNSFSSFLTGYS